MPALPWCCLAVSPKQRSQPTMGCNWVKTSVFSFLSQWQSWQESSVDKIFRIINARGLEIKLCLVWWKLLCRWVVYTKLSVVFCCCKTVKNYKRVNICLHSTDVWKNWSWKFPEPLNTEGIKTSNLAHLGFQCTDYICAAGFWGLWALSLKLTVAGSSKVFVFFRKVCFILLVPSGWERVCSQYRLIFGYTHHSESGYLASVFELSIRLGMVLTSLARLSDALDLQYITSSLDLKSFLGSPREKFWNHHRFSTRVGAWRTHIWIDCVVLIRGHEVS